MSYGLVLSSEYLASNLRTSYAIAKRASPKIPQNRLNNAIMQKCFLQIMSLRPFLTNNWPFNPNCFITGNRLIYFGSAHSYVIPYGRLAFRNLRFQNLKMVANFVWSVKRNEFCSKKEKNLKSKTWLLWSNHSQVFRNSSTCISNRI